MLGRVCGGKAPVAVLGPGELGDYRDVGGGVTQPEQVAAAQAQEGRWWPSSRRDSQNG